MRSVQFGLSSIRIFFPSFFLLFFFFFFGYFPWQTLTIHKIEGAGEGIIIFLVFHFHPLTSIHLIYRDFYHLFLLNLFLITRLTADEWLVLPRYLHFICIFMHAIKSELLNLRFQWDLSSYQTITLLLKCERLKKQRFALLPTTVYLSHLPNPTPGPNWSSNCFPKCIRNRGCLIFLQEIGRRITKSNFRVLK